MQRRRAKELIEVQKPVLSCVLLSDPLITTLAFSANDSLPDLPILSPEWITRTWKTQRS